MATVLSLSPFYVRAQDTPTPRNTLIQPTVMTGLPPIYTPTRTPSHTVRPSQTATASVTPTATATRTPTNTATHTSTNTATQTSTVTQTSTATHTPTLTFTPYPAASVTATLTASRTGTSTTTITATNTATSTVTPSATRTQTKSATIGVSPTATLLPTDTLSPSPSASSNPTSTPTITFTPSITSTRTPPLIESTRPNSNNSTPAISPFLLIGGAFATILLGGYMLSYARGAAAIDRYSAGFILHDCPVCQSGQLELEERVYRMLGLPRVRRTVRCNKCRSVLREVGKRRWRYAIDPAANRTLYESMNNRILKEDELLSMIPEYKADNPQYIE